MGWGYLTRFVRPRPAAASSKLHRGSAGTEPPSRRQAATPVDIARGEALDRTSRRRSISEETKTDRILWKLVRIFDPRWLGVFDPIEPLLLPCRHDLSVASQRGGRFMKDGIESEDFHLDRPMYGDVSR